MTRGGKREGAGRKKGIELIQVSTTVKPETKRKLHRLAEKRGVSVGRVLDDMVDFLIRFEI